VESIEHFSQKTLKPHDMYSGTNTPVTEYHNYLERSILTASPIELVRMLYQFVIDNVREANRCTLSGDIGGRGRAVSRATDGLLELLSSLNQQDGGQISQRLAELYGYMASRVLQGHAEQASAPFEEVESLMTTLLDSWEKLGQTGSLPQTTEAPYGAISEDYTPVSVSF
jgi:flagellar protein FliS